MAEMDAFERRVADTLLGYADDAAPAIDAAAVARRAVVGHPRRRGAGFLPWRLAAMPRVAWLLLLAGLIVALVGGTLLVGSQLRRQLPAVVPPVGQVYECPPGSNPDEPGPVDQTRPGDVDKIAFDRRAGRLVALTGSADGLGPETWTFDVCTNTWTQMHPARVLPEEDLGQLVYDVDSDVTIWVASGKVWAYDLQADTWTEKGVAPSEAHLGAYDPVSGLVVAASGYDLVGLWTYDVETDTWTQISQVNGEPCGYELFAYDVSVDRMVVYSIGWFGSEEAICLIDIRMGTWSGTRAATPPGFDTGWYMWVPSIVYDEATERMVFSDGRRLGAYDATADRWEILVEADPGVEVPLWMAYDPLHRRLVGVGWDEDTPVVAFDPVTREWTVLLDRDPR